MEGTAEGNAKHITFWCALWPRRIIGPYFFEVAESNAVTLNGQRYLVVIKQVFVPQLEDIALVTMR